MSEDITEYTVRDYSAVDRQIDEIARRERILTNRLNLENLKRFILIGLIVVGGICLLLLALAIAYRIAFPPQKKISESTLPVEVTVKNEPIILKEPINKSNNNNAPSNKIFGMQNNDTNQIKQKNTITSKLDNTKVVTFKSQPSQLIGFRNVHTGWNWETPKANKPNSQFCYTHNIDMVRIDLAVKSNSNIDSLYDYRTANKYNVSKNQWDGLVKKCLWYTN